MSVQEIQKPGSGGLFTATAATTPSTDEHHYRQTTVVDQCIKCGSSTTKKLNFQSRPNPLENETPEKKIAAVLRRAISDMTSTSFQEALKTTTTTPPLSPSPPQIRRAISDVTSLSFQDELKATITPPPPPPPARTTFSPAVTTTTPPAYIRRAVSDVTPSAFQEALNATTTAPPPPVRTVFSLAGKTGTNSSNRGESPHSKRLKKMMEMVKEIEQKCEEVMRETEEDEEHVQDGSENINGNNLNHPQEETEAVTEESVSMDWTNFGLEIQFRCPCGKGYQVLLTENNCFYKLA